jgi:hypothetical protein
MNGLQAYKLYQAIKLHFTTVKYNVFETRGIIRCSQEAFEERNDQYLFERLARTFKESDYIKYIASNFIYGNRDVIYDWELGDKNFTEFQRRRQNITYIFQSDLRTFYEEKTKGSCKKTLSMLQLQMSKRVSIETLIILDEIDNITNKIRQDAPLACSFFEDQLLTISKAHKFIKYDRQKIMKAYTDLQTEYEVSNG